MGKQPQASSTLEARHGAPSLIPQRRVHAPERGKTTTAKKAHQHTHCSSHSTRFHDQPAGYVATWHYRWEKPLYLRRKQPPASAPMAPTIGDPHRGRKAAIDCRFQKYWEAGGNCNLAFAAARLGLRCSALGHVGEEVYGKFLLDVLEAEGISVVGMLENTDVTACRHAYETLLCWVLVDPFQRHGFCSRADFSKEPAFSWIQKLPAETKTAIHHSKILFSNGYAFDEFSPDVIASAIDCAIDAGTSVFFDPGPRGRSLLHGNLDEQRALEHALRLSDVLLLTSDEAESLTNIQNPIEAGQELLRRGTRTKWVVVKMGSKGSIMITDSAISCAPSFKIRVVDTVGCGDSFTAAIAFGFLHNLPAISTLALANAVGAATATGCGAGRNVAHLDKVLKLLSESDLNEEETTWTELIEGCSACPEVLVLSKTPVNGRFVNVVPVCGVVSDLLSMLEATPERSTVQA